MAVTLFQIKEGYVCSPIPNFLRGRFLELYDPEQQETLEDGTVRDKYMGWVHVSNDGVLEIGEPGA